MNIENQNNVLKSNRNAFFIIGCLEASWAPLVPYVKQSFGLNEAELGLLLFCSGMGSVTALPLAGWTCMRFGVKRTTYVSGVLMALALLVISMRWNVGLTAIMLLIFGACTILIDVAANINGVEVEQQLKRPLMSGFHGGYSLGTLVGTGLVSLLFAIGFSATPSIAVVIALSLLVIFSGCRSLFNREQITGEKPATAQRRNRFSIPPAILIIGMLCFIMYASEGAVMSWSAVYVNENRGVDMEYAGFFYTAFAIMMTVMRFTGDRLVACLGNRRVVTIGSLMVALGFTLVVAVPHFVGSIIGFALIGLGAANIVPRLVSLGGTVKGIEVQNSISIINALGYSGILMGPVFIGFIAKHWGLATSFLGIGALAVVVAVVAYLLFGRAKE